jgi:hypothetical protein
MSDKEDTEIAEKLQALQDFHLRDEGLLGPFDHKGVSVKVQELQYALFQRQHKDFLKINDSVKELTTSKRLEKLTHWLIGITVALGILTVLDILKDAQ